jgi:hypothetical protein
MINMSQHSDWLGAGRLIDLVEATLFSSPLNFVQMGTEAHPSSYPVGTAGSYPEETGRYMTLTAGLFLALRSRILRHTSSWLRFN